MSWAAAGLKRVTTADFVYPATTLTRLLSVIELVEDLQGQSSQLTLGQKPANRYTEVRLRPEAMHFDWVSIPDAWLNYRHVEGTLHRVRVRASENVVTHDPPEWEDEEQTMDAQYAEAREWWKQGLVGLGVYSELD